MSSGLRGRLGHPGRCSRHFIPREQRASGAAPVRDRPSRRRCAEEKRELAAAVEFGKLTVPSERASIDENLRYGFLSRNLDQPNP